MKLTVFHLQQMVEGTPFVINEIKTQGGTAKHLTVNINKAVYALILERKADIEVLCQGKEGNDLVIAAKGKRKVLHSAQLTEKLNKVLRHASKTVRKNLKTHTFRIGLTTSIIEVDGIEAAQRVIGHANLATTAVYNRTQYKEKDFLRVMSKVERFRREKKVPRQYKKKEQSAQAAQGEGRN